MFASFWSGALGGLCRICLVEPINLIPWNEHGMRPYIRVSTKAQQTRSQMDDLVRFYKKNRWEWPPPEYVYMEKASAFKGGGLKARKEFIRLLTEIRAGEAKGFVVNRWNRYFRNTRMALTIHEELYALGAQAFSSEKPYNPFTPDNKARFIREIAEAEAYSLELSTRIRGGKDAQAARGLVYGGVRPFGVKRWVFGTPRWKKADALIVRHAINTYLEGKHSLATLADEISTPEQRFTEQRVRAWLVNPVYYGLVRIVPDPTGPTDSWRIRHNRAKIRPASFKGIVSRKKYQLVKAMLAERRIGGSGAHLRKKHKYAFGGKAMTCAACGKGMIGQQTQQQRGGKSGYFCGDWHISQTCAMRSRMIFEADVVSQFGALLKLCGELRPEHVEAAKPIIKSILAKLPSDRTAPKAMSKTELLRRRESLASRFARNLIPFELFMLEKDELDRLSLAEPVQQASSVSHEVAFDEFNEIVQAMPNLGATWDEATTEERRAIVKLLTRKIYVDVGTRRIVSIDATPRFAYILAATGVQLPETAPLTYQTEHLFAPAQYPKVEPLWRVMEPGVPETVATLAAKTGKDARHVKYAMQRAADDGHVLITRHKRDNVQGPAILVYQLADTISDVSTGTSAVL